MRIRTRYLLLFVVLSACVDTPEAKDSLAGERLFFRPEQRLSIDIAAGLAEPDAAESSLEEASSPVSVTQITVLTFNGFLQSEGEVQLWINNMPWPAGGLLSGIRTVQWQPAISRLMVILSGGSVHQLLPGESIKAAPPWSDPAAATGDR